MTVADGCICTSFAMHRQINVTHLILLLCSSDMLFYGRDVMWFVVIENSIHYSTSLFYCSIFQLIVIGVISCIYDDSVCKYRHMPIGKVWIYRLLFVCMFVRLRISPPTVNLATSNFARWFIGVLGRESPIFGNFAPPEAQNPMIRSLACRPRLTDVRAMFCL